MNIGTKQDLSEIEKQERNIQRRIKSWESRLLSEALSLFIAEGELPQWLRTAISGSSYKTEMNEIEACDWVECYAKQQLGPDDRDKVFSAWLFLGSSRFYKIYDQKKKEGRKLRISYGNATSRTKPLACCGRRPRRYKFARL